MYCYKIKHDDMQGVWGINLLEVWTVHEANLYLRWCMKMEWGSMCNDFSQSKHFGDWHNVHLHTMSEHNWMVPTIQIIKQNEDKVVVLQEESIKIGHI